MRGRKTLVIREDARDREIVCSMCMYIYIYTYAHTHTYAYIYMCVCVYMFLVYKCVSTDSLLPRKCRKGDETGWSSLFLPRVAAVVMRETLGGYAGRGGAEIN